MAPKNTAALHVGRLVEIRFAAGYRTLADVDALFEAIGQIVREHPGTRFVSVADWRQCRVMSAEAAQRAIRGMSGNNPLVERSAAIASMESPTAVMQFVRMIRDSQNEHRRLFFEAPSLVTWLGEVLSPAEVKRLRAFLAEGADTD